MKHELSSVGEVIWKQIAIQTDRVILLFFRYTHINKKVIGIVFQEQAVDLCIDVYLIFLELGQSQIFVIPWYFVNEKKETIANSNLKF